MVRGRKVDPRAWTPRDEGDIRRCYAAAGGREEFDRRVDAVLRGLKRERKRGPNVGRPSNPFFSNFLANRYQGKPGLFVVQLTVNGDEPYPLLRIVSRRKRWMDILTPQEESRAIVGPLWKKLEKRGRAATLGMTEEAAIRRLADDMKKAIEAAVVAEMNWFQPWSEPHRVRARF